MGHNNRIGSESGTRFGVEIYSEGYKSTIRVYRNGVECLYRDEIQYINQKIATIVSRYREMYRYQLMMSSKYGCGWVVEFNANQIRDIGFDGGVDSIYSDLDSLSIMFSDRGSEELNDILHVLTRAYEFSRLLCSSLALQQYAGDNDKRHWEELLDTVVSGITDVLERFYVYYVGLLTNRDVIGYMLQRYENGLVSGCYHNELANGILHLTIDVALYRIDDVEVDMLYTYRLDRDVYGDVEITAIDKNLYYLPLVDSGNIGGLCDLLEVVAYVNDAMLKYYRDNQIDLIKGELSKSDRYQAIAENFLDVVLNRYDIPDYYECGGIVFNYDNNTDIIEMFITIDRLSTKMMASRVFDVGRFERYYRDMLVECAERFKNTRHD